MQLLLDEQLSPTRVGVPLTRAGHDVECVAATRTLAGLDDVDVLAHAAASGRILITRNARDFVPIARDWAETGRRHAGLLVIWTRQANEFGALVDEILSALDSVGGHADWDNVTRSL